MRKKLSAKMYLIIFAMLIFMICPVVSGCFFDSLFGSLKLNTPTITMHSSSKCLSWESITGAISYQVYCNEINIDSVINDNTLDSYFYD